MGPFIDPRNLFRTPGFAQDDLYDDQIDIPPALADFSPSPPPPSRDFDMPPPPQQQRQRIELPAAPLPPKPGLMRKIIGTAASMYVPQIGREILAPGYDRQMREYRNERQRLMDEGELNVKAADEASRWARAEAEGNRGGAEQARTRKLDAEAGYVGKRPITVNRNERLFDPASNKVMLDAAEAPEVLPQSLQAAAARAISIKNPVEREEMMKRITAAHNLLNPERPITQIKVGDDGKMVAISVKPSEVAQAGGQMGVGNIYKRPPQVAAGAADDTPMSPEAINMAARMYMKTGTLPPMGQGRSAAGNRREIMNRAAAIDSGADIASNKAGYRSDTSSLQSLQRTQDAIMAFENTTLKNLDTFLNTAKQVVDTGSPLFNKPVRALSAAVLGSTNTTKFNTARQVAVTEAAKVLNNPTSNAALSDSARHELQQIMDPDATLAQIEAAVGILKQDMHNRKTSGESQLQAIRGRISGGQGGVVGQPVLMMKNGVKRAVPADKVAAATAAGYTPVGAK